MNIGLSPSLDFSLVRKKRARFSQPHFSLFAFCSSSCVGLFACAGWNYKHTVITNIEIFIFLCVYVYRIRLQFSFRLHTIQHLIWSLLPSPNNYCCYFYRNMKLTCGLVLCNLVLSTGFFTPSSVSRKSSSLQVAQEIGLPGTAKISKPWNELGFEFTPTKSNVRITYKDGAWGKMEICEVSFFFKYNLITYNSDNCPFQFWFILSTNSFDSKGPLH